MNDNTIESIEWHRDQLAKLLSNDDGFGKIELGLNEILEKDEKKVRVKATAKRKGHYRNVKSKHIIEVNDKVYTNFGYAMIENVNKPTSGTPTYKIKIIDGELKGKNMLVTRDEIKTRN